MFFRQKIIEEDMLLDEAIKKRRELIANRKGRKLYTNQDIEAFRKIEQQIKEEKGNIKKYWEFAVKGFFLFLGSTFIYRKDRISKNL